MLTWQRCSQARRGFCKVGILSTPDDVLDVAQAVLSVRLGIEQQYEEQVFKDVLTGVSVPVYPAK